MRKIKRKKLTVPLQNIRMLQKYPSFKYTKKGNFWKGHLQPTTSSPIYEVKIKYDWFRPKVFILNPQISKDAPHCYGDGSLCLYYPSDNSYNNSLFIADTIIPWTSEWLYYYEKWLEDEVWWGPEAPHSPKKLES